MNRRVISPRISYIQVRNIPLQPAPPPPRTNQTPYPTGPNHTHIPPAGMPPSYEATIASGEYMEGIHIFHLI